MNKFKEFVTGNMVKVSATAAAVSLALPMVSFASEVSSDALPAEVTTAITSGFSQLQGAATQVVVLAVGAAVAVIVVSGGAKYALKQIKGVLSKAA